MHLASQVSKILPDSVSHYNALGNAWGAENLKIHLTDPDPTACAQLQEGMECTPDIDV